MSDWKGHLKLGFVYQIVTLMVLIGVHIYLKQMPTLVDFILIPFVFVLSPLFPDIDHQSSKITLFFYLIGVMCLWPVYFLFAQYMIYVIIFLTLVVLISQFVHHRGITHRWYAILIFHIIIALYTKHYSICILSLSGMISHLIADNTF